MNTISIYIILLLITPCGVPNNIGMVYNAICPIRGMYIGVADSQCT